MPSPNLEIKISSWKNIIFDPDFFSYPRIDLYLQKMASTTSQTPYYRSATKMTSKVYSYNLFFGEALMWAGLKNNIQEVCLKFIEIYVLDSKIRSSSPTMI